MMDPAISLASSWSANSEQNQEHEGKSFVLFFITQQAAGDPPTTQPAFARN